MSLPLTVEIICQKLTNSIYPARRYDSNALHPDFVGIFNYICFLKKCNLETICLEKIQEYVQWRQAFGPLEINPDEILGCNILDIYKRIPVCHCGYDKTYKPVIYFLFSCHNSHEALKLTTTSQLLDYEVWQNDAINELCYYQSLSTGTFITSAMLVVDIAGLEMPYLTPEFNHLLSRRADINGKYYPYLFERILIINAIEDSETTLFVKACCRALSSPYCVITVVTKSASIALSEYISLDQLPSDYGGNNGSIYLISHPFDDNMKRRVRPSNAPFTSNNDNASYQGGLFFTQLNRNVPRVNSEVDDDFSISQQQAMMNGNLYSNDNRSYSIFSVSTVHPSLVGINANSYYYVTQTPLRHNSGSNHHSMITPPHLQQPSYSARMRSLSGTSSSWIVDTHGLQDIVSKADVVLSNIPMTVVAKSVLSIFAEMYTGHFISKSPQFIDVQQLTFPNSLMANEGINSTTGGGAGGYPVGGSNSASNAGVNLNLYAPTTPGGNYSDVMSTNSSSSLQSNLLSDSVLPMPSGTTTVSIQYHHASNSNTILHEMNSSDLQLHIDPKTFSAMHDGVMESSVGGGDRLVIRTTSGAVVFRVTDIPVASNPVANVASVATGTTSASYGSFSSSNISSLRQKCIVPKRHTGSYVLSNGQMYRISRGAFLSGWLQKWPMESQSFGSYTHRYFILDNNMLRYWKNPPESSMETSDVTRCRGSLLLTPNTTLRRDKSFFGNSIITVKSENDSLQICAYSSGDDYAWFNEIQHAIQRVKGQENDVERSKYIDSMYC